MEVTDFGQYVSTWLKCRFLQFQNCLWPATRTSCHKTNFNKREFCRHGCYWVWNCMGTSANNPMERSFTNVCSRFNLRISLVWITWVQHFKILFRALIINAFLPRLDGFLSVDGIALEDAVEPRPVHGGQLPGLLLLEYSEQRPDPGPGAPHLVVALEDVVEPRPAHGERDGQLPGSPPHGTQRQRPGPGAP